MSRRRQKGKTESYVFLTGSYPIEFKLCMIASCMDNDLLWVTLALIFFREITEAFPASAQTLSVLTLFFCDWCYLSEFFESRHYDNLCHVLHSQPSFDDLDPFLMARVILKKIKDSFVYFFGFNVSRLCIVNCSSFCLKCIWFSKYPWYRMKENRQGVHSLWLLCILCYSLLVIANSKTSLLHIFCKKWGRSSTFPASPSFMFL